MIDHVSINTNNFAKAKEFYAKALAPLGYKVMMEFAEWSVAGLGSSSPDLWINAKGTTMQQHVALVANDKATVDAFYKEGLAAGGSDNGAPGYRKDYSPGYYGAFLLDPDGNNIEAVFHDPNPSA